VARVRVPDFERAPDLLKRIRFDARLESMAFRRLGELDLEGARSAFGELVDRLDLRTTGARQREVVLLLLDVLQRVNRRVHRGPGSDSDLQRNRVALLRQFAGYDDPEDSRQAFMQALSRLLSPLHHAEDNRHPLVQRAQSFIEENYHRRISLSVVASHLHVSSNYLSRTFRKVTGNTLTSHIHAVRLEHAMMLLAAGGRTISEIAYLVGYQNYRDFYRNFVKHKNASPRQIQRRLAPETPVEPGGAQVDGGSR
jgi:AraC-like DNA-binding protein